MFDFNQVVTFEEENEAQFKLVSLVWLELGHWLLEGA